MHMLVTPMAAIDAPFCAARMGKDSSRRDTTSVKQYVQGALLQPFLTFNHADALTQRDQPKTRRKEDHMGRSAVQGLVTSASSSASHSSIEGASSAKIVMRALVSSGRLAKTCMASGKDALTVAVETDSSKEKRGLGERAAVATTLQRVRLRRSEKHPTKQHEDLQNENHNKLQRQETPICDSQYRKAAEHEWRPTRHVIPKKA
eukprot:1841192-Amphidinium_carterae.1